MTRKILLPCLLLSLLATVSTAQAAGIVVEPSFFSNALGMHRTALFYLPEGCTTSSERYPVVYFLHGADGAPGSWYLTDFVPMLDEPMGGGLIDPVIIVEPDSCRCEPPLQWQDLGFAHRAYHFHVNSELLGDNEDYLAEDLVAWVGST